MSTLAPLRLGPGACLDGSGNREESRGVGKMRGGLTRRGGLKIDAFSHGAPGIPWKAGIV